MQNYQLIIFDWDGTLMDSVARIVSSLQGAARASSLEAPAYDVAKQVIGLSLPKAMQTLFPEEKHLHDELMGQYKLHYRELDTTQTPLFDHAVELLTGLKAAQKLLAVATGKGRSGLQRVWQQSDTGHYFHASRCADESLSKPHPDMLQSLLAELDIAPGQALMVGDTSFDLEMAQFAGVDSVGVTHGVHTSEILAQYQPKAIVNSLPELAQLLLPA
ncbi:HAD-IA family hydrolase [Thalassomonas viridans]|uniref:HAD-IA family hydrolase n=1 Tax=Thalassomonas viridans TaxID=137584 RepID=A0AAF0CC38_9GAMM|nr:HAD-IA family hydrolase [Thalassomonas viridans]WDE07620.1 HAD-IA family hydrolase [Thalassomonas viridans]